jgi:pimeloyl-ACP methyl ester carboxylesterase
MCVMALAQREEFLQDSTEECVLKGTLLWPMQPADRVVLIIAGSGPTDRDGNNPRLKSNYQKWLAEGLAAQGVATLRYDKRGVGKSTMRNGDETAVQFSDFVTDAVRWIRRLKSDARFKKVIVLGHSEGALVGMLAVQQEPCSGFVSAAGLGRPLQLVLKEQLAANPYNPPALVAEANATIDSLQAGYRVKKVSPLLQSLFRPSVQPFLISFMKLNPATEFARISIPVQILQGATDLQVTVADAELLRQARPDAQWALVEEMNHVFRQASADRMANLSTYMQADVPVMPAAVTAIVQFVNSIQ